MILDVNRSGSTITWKGMFCEHCYIGDYVLSELTGQDTVAAIRQVCRQWKHNLDQCVTGVECMHRFPESTFPQMIKFPAQFPCLTSLNLRGCELEADDTFLRALSSLTALTSLSLADCGKLVTHDCLHELAGLTALVTLDLSDCVLSDEEETVSADWLRPLASLVNLADINFENVEDVTDSWLVALRDLPALIHLDLTGCHQVTDAGIIAIASVNNRIKLYLRFCKVSPDIFAQFHSNSLSHKTKTVRVKLCENIW